MTTPNPASKTTRDLTIENRNGLHARPAALFVKTSSRFRSEVWVEKNGERVMGLMMLAAGKGSVLRVTAQGEDAENVLSELEQLIATRFGEE